MSRAIRAFAAALVATGVVVATGTGIAAPGQEPGSVYGFGTNFYGELASTTNLGAATHVPGLATPPAGGSAVARVAQGGSHSLLLTANGQLFTVGHNFYGQLGVAAAVGTPTPTPVPAPVPLPGLIGAVVQAAGGSASSLVATSSGQLYGFGNNQYGQLGTATNNGTAMPNPTPTLVTLPGLSGTVEQLSAGVIHSLVLTSSGQVYAFGHNRYGQLGNATNNGTTTANPTPTLVTLPGLVGSATQVAAGSYHSLVATSSGQLYSFGWNYYGQLGNATNNLTDTANPTPTLVTLPGQVGAVTQLAGGGDHSLALTASGQLYAFGSNQFGPLGNPTNNDAATANANPTPTPVTLPGQVGAITQIAAGAEHSVAVTASGQLYTWGENQWGQLGNLANIGAMKANPTPTVVALPAGTTIDTVAKGSQAYRVLALVSNLAITTAALPAVTVGEPYEATLQATGGTAPRTWSVSGLPGGLQFDPATGVIKGKPAASGVFVLTVKLSDLYGSSVSRTYSLNVTPAGQAGATVPRLTALKQSSTKWRLGSKLARLVTVVPTPVKKGGVPVGTTFTFGLDQAARVSFAFKHAVQGRKVAGKCVAKTKGNAGKPRCTRTLSDGTLRVQGRAGLNRLRFEGRVSALKKLKAGRYAVVTTASKDAGKPSPAQSRGFTIVA